MRRPLLASLLFAACTATSWAAGKSPNDVVYGAAVSQCLAMESGGKTGKQMRNMCDFRINVSFCQAKQTDNECAQGQIGNTSMAPHESRYLLDEVVQTYFVACRDPYYVSPGAARWDNSMVVGRCQASRAASQAAKRRH